MQLDDVDEVRLWSVGIVQHRLLGVQAAVDQQHPPAGCREALRQRDRADAGAGPTGSRHGDERPHRAVPLCRRGRGRGRQDVLERVQQLALIEVGGKHHRRAEAVPRPPPAGALDHDWDATRAHDVGEQVTVDERQVPVEQHRAPALAVVEPCLQVRDRLAVGDGEGDRRGRRPRLEPLRP